jgi:hypothetical protein
MEMPTAIVRTYYSGDGFIVAADGMVSDQDNKVKSLEKRKIFPFGGNKTMVFSLAGRTMIGPGEGPEIWFDFRKRIDEAVQSVSMSRSPTLTLYAERIKTRILRELAETCDKIQCDHKAIVQMFIDGYYRGSASSLTISFYRRAQDFQAEVIRQPLSSHNLFYHGSIQIHDLMQRNDSRFCTGPYIRALEEPVPLLSDAMRGAILYSRAYIEACSSAEARDLDPFCETIGGKIHMVSITPTDGIRWVPGFEHVDKP